jgi:DNA-binding NarL/FixJ family response regulator
MGFEAAELDDPYAAAAELHRRPLVYRALILSLASLFREELSIIPALKRRLPHVEIYLTHLEGRQAAFAEAIRLGADGLLADDGQLHRMSASATAAATPIETQPSVASSVESGGDEPLRDLPSPEPVLSAEELRALLAENPIPDDQP